MMGLSKMSKRFCNLYTESCISLYMGMMHMVYVMHMCKVSQFLLGHLGHSFISHWKQWSYGSEAMSVAAFEVFDCWTLTPMTEEC